MKKSRINVAIIVDTWFPDFGSKPMHVKNIRSYLSHTYKIDSELYYARQKNIFFQLAWPLWVIQKVLQDHKKNPYNLIHSHGVISGLPAKMLSFLLRIPVIHTVHGSPHLDQRIHNVHYYLEKFILTQLKYDHQISVFEHFQKYHNVNQNITIIQNGVDVTSFDQIRAKKNTNPTLIWVGKNIPEKGLSVLKEAITRVRKKIPKLQTELVTGGRLTGDKLIKAYKGSHVFVLPSLAEGQPITLLEAWAAKLPVIATKVGDNTKLIKDGINGILIEPDNTSQLVKAILKILRSRNKGKLLGLSGYRLVKKRFTWNFAAQQTYSVYQKVLRIQ